MSRKIGIYIRPSQMENGSMSLLVKNHASNQQTLGTTAETQATTEFSTRDAYKLTP